MIREARGRAGLTQRELARSAGMPQPAIARIEAGDVVPRVDTLARLLAGCGVALGVQQRPRESDEWAQIRAEIRELLRVSPRQRVLSLPKSAGSRFRPLELVRIIAGRRVRFVLVGEIAARVHGAPLMPGSLEIAVQPERVNSERLTRALEAMVGTPAPGKGLPTGLRDLRGRGQIRTRLGNVWCWWPTNEAYRRLEGAATEMRMVQRPVLVASIDDVIERWPRRGDELELLAALREEIDQRAAAGRRRSKRSVRSRP